MRFICCLLILLLLFLIKAHRLHHNNSEPFLLPRYELFSSLNEYAMGRYGTEISHLEENVLGIKGRRRNVHSSGVTQPVTRRRKQLPLEVLSNPLLPVMLVQKKGLLQSSISQPCPSFHIFPYLAVRGDLLSAQAY